MSDAVDLIEGKCGERRAATFYADGDGRNCDNPCADNRAAILAFRKTGQNRLLRAGGFRLRVNPPTYADGSDLSVQNIDYTRTYELNAQKRNRIISFCALLSCVRVGKKIVLKQFLRQVLIHARVSV